MAIPPASSREHARLTPEVPPGDARWRRHGSRGQSLVELAMTMPMLLLMVLFGLDFGRVFLGWVSLSQATREAANFAAMNPKAWTLPYNLTAQAEYERLVQAEAAEINCTLESPISAPTFGSGTSIGAPARVELTCEFHLITPFISLILGDSIPVSAASAFPVRAGNIEGIPVQSTAPTDEPDPTGSAAPSSSPAPTTSADPSATIAPTAAPTQTPAPTPTAAPSQAGYCHVTSLLGKSTSKALSIWRSAGFTGGVIFSPLVPPNYRIAWQSLAVGTKVPCTSWITVRSAAP